jgi:hypothetical protein
MNLNRSITIPTGDRSRIAHCPLHRKRALDRFAAALLGLLLLLAGGSTQAALVTQTIDFDFSLSPTAIPESPTNPGSYSFTGQVVTPGSLTGSFSPFDSELGTLTSFDVVWDLYGRSDWQNLSFGYMNFDIGQPFSSPNNYLTFAGRIYNAGSRNVSMSITPSFGTYYRDLTMSFTNSFNLASWIDPAILAAATGSSDFEIASGAGSVVSISSSDPGGSVSASVSGTLSLTYNYEPAPSVPLPATTLLLLPGLGLLGLGARRARRQSNPRLR